MINKKRRVFVLMLLILTFSFTGCSSSKSYNGTWILIKADNFKLNPKQNNKEQYKNKGITVPYQILFLDNAVYFKSLKGVLYQKCNYKYNSDGFILHTESDNTFTVFSDVNKNEIFVKWKGKPYIYINSVFLEG